MKNRLFLSAITVFLLSAFACSPVQEHAKPAPINTNAAANTTDHSKMDHGPAMEHAEMATSPGAADAPYDLQFLDTMIAHHEEAVVMSLPALEKAQHPELKQMASAIISEQEKEIAEMKRWRNNWFPGAPPAINMEMPGMSSSMDRMNSGKLESATGQAYDLEFIAQMIPHHAGALEMARDASQRAEREEIKKLAEIITKDQTEEINQMRSWQAAWAK